MFLPPQGSAVSGVCAAPGSAIAAVPDPGASAPDLSSFVCLPVSCVPGDSPAEPSLPPPPSPPLLGEPGQPLPRSPSDRRRPYPPTAPWPRFCQFVFRSIFRCGGPGLVRAVSTNKIAGIPRRRWYLGRCGRVGREQRQTPEPLVRSLEK